MTKGPNRLVLDQYLDSAADGWVRSAGRDWKKKADDLQTLAEGLQQAAAQAELRIGEQTLTGPALRKSMEESSVSLTTKADQLRAAGEALRQVGQQISDTKDLRDNMADLGPKPSPYQAPANTTGIEPTDEEIAAQAAASSARQQERSAWQTAYEKQEARSLALTKQMDAAFLAAIPPMKEIHGQQDPTEPPPSAPSAPGGPYLPGTQAPPVTGGGAGGSGGGADGGFVRTGLVQVGNENTHPTLITQPPTQVTQPPTTTPITTPTTVPTTLPTHVPTEVPSTSVGGTSQSGIAYQSPGSGISAPTTSGGSAGASAAALGAAGAAGGASAMTGGVRPGALPTGTGGSAVRPIGSTGRAGAPGALSRAATAGSPTTAARSAGAAGSPTSRAAAAGSTAGRGAAGGRGAATGATGSSTGSRSGGRGATGSGGRGASGSRAAGTAGAAGAAGRGGRKGDGDRATDRDRLVYDQDWLGDDDVAPGVLD